MKTLFKVLILISCLNMYSQSGIGIQLTQDVRLATIKDDHGNKPFTTDLRLDVSMNGGNIDSNNWGFLGLTFEQANLHSGKFIRYGLQGGWAFKSGIHINTKYLKLDLDTKVEPYVGLSVINRMNGNRNWLSFECGFNWVFELKNNFDTILKTNLMQRGDLEVFNDKSANFKPWDWQPQFSVGFRYTI